LREYGRYFILNGLTGHLCTYRLAQVHSSHDLLLMLDNVPVDAQTGNGSALIGVVASTDALENLEVFFTDDNTNTLDVLSV
jgi:hypothetical protein